MPDLNCPFCNAAVTGAASRAADGRVLCARCGEPLPAALAAQLAGEPIPAASTATAAPGVPGKKMTLLVVLGVMVTMATIGGVYAWVTKDFRRQNDYRTQKKTNPTGTAPTAADLPVLGFLPTRCNVLAAIHVAELYKHPATRRLFDEPRPAPLELILGKLTQWTGLKLSDLDQVALGAEVKAKLPQLFAIVQTRQPYLPGKIAAALAPAQPTKHRGKMLIRFAVEPAGEALLWCHSDRVLVVVVCLDAATTDDLDAIPPRPRPGTEGFVQPLRTALADRLPTTSSLWFAGHFDEPSALGDLLKLTGQKNAALDLLLQTKTFVLCLEAQDKLTLFGHFLSSDAASATRLQTLLESRPWPDALSYKVAGPPPDTAEPWVTLQARGDLAAGLSAWSR